MTEVGRSHCEEDDVLECRPLSTFQQLMDWEPGSVDGIRAESLTVPIGKACDCTKSGFTGKSACVS